MFVRPLTAMWGISSKYSRILNSYVMLCSNVPLSCWTISNFRLFSLNLMPFAAFVLLFLLICAMCSSNFIFHTWCKVSRCKIYNFSGAIILVFRIYEIILVSPSLTFFSSWSNGLIRYCSNFCVPVNLVKSPRSLNLWNNLVEPTNHSSAQR